MSNIYQYFITLFSDEFIANFGNSGLNLSKLVSSQKKEWEYSDVILDFVST
jgi:hypothetical protein